MESIIIGLLSIVILILSYKLHQFEKKSHNNCNKKPSLNTISSNAKYQHIIDGKLLFETNSTLNFERYLHNNPRALQAHYIILHDLLEKSGGYICKIGASIDELDVWDNNELTEADFWDGDESDKSLQ